MVIQTWYFLKKKKKNGHHCIANPLLTAFWELSTKKMVITPDNASPQKQKARIQPRFPLANYSTDMAISNIYDHLIQNIDQNLYSCSIFLDLFKAFDTVDHKILLNKMKSNFGIKGIALNQFASYLKGH